MTTDLISILTALEIEGGEPIENLMADYKDNTLPKKELEEALKSKQPEVSIQAKLKERLYKTLETYCSEGDNSKLYGTIKGRVDEIHKFMCNDSLGQVYSPEKQRVSKLRQITSKEVTFVYYFAIQEFERIIGVISENKKVTKIKKVELEDFYYVLNEGVKSAFESVGDLCGKYREKCTLKGMIH